MSTNIGDFSAPLIGPSDVPIGGINGIAVPNGGNTPAIVDEVIAAIALAAFAALLIPFVKKRLIK